MVLTGRTHLYFASRQLVDNLHEALASRAVIEQAKGIVMARNRCGADEAFASLRQESQHTHVKLRDVAAVSSRVFQPRKPARPRSEAAKA
jgi:AmiR/NasT family two-component response regulator